MPDGPVDLTGITRLPSPDAAEATRLTAALAALAPHEGAMRRALHDLQPVTLPVTPSTRLPEWRQMALDAPLAALAAGVVRLAGQAAADLALGTPGDGYTSGWSPWRIDLAQPLATLHLPQDAGFPADLPARDPALRGLTIPPVGVTHGAHPLPGTIITLAPGTLHYDASALPEAEAATLCKRLAAFSAVASAAPDAPLSTLPVLSQAELHALLHSPNQTAADYDRTLTIPQAFAAQVARTPDATALVCEGTSLTYAALNAAANRTAHALRAMGVGPGSLVGLHLRRTPALVIAALGIQKAGGAYVPMDPAYPADRTALYIADSACPVIVTQGDLIPHLPAHQAQVLDIDAVTWPRE